MKVDLGVENEIPNDRAVGLKVCDLL